MCLSISLCSPMLTSWHKRVHSMKNLILLELFRRVHCTMKVYCHLKNLKLPPQRPIAENEEVWIKLFLNRTKWNTEESVKPCVTPGCVLQLLLYVSCIWFISVKKTTENWIFWDLRPVAPDCCNVSYKHSQQQQPPQWNVVKQLFFYL